VVNLRTLVERLMSQVDVINGDCVEPRESQHPPPSGWSDVASSTGPLPNDVRVRLVSPEFMQMALNFEDCRRRWLRLEQDLGSCKEVLTKAETERGSLEVKLKHARNQVDVEIRRRQKAEAECEKLVRHTLSPHAVVEPTMLFMWCVQTTYPEMLCCCCFYRIVRSS